MLLANFSSCSKDDAHTDQEKKGIQIREDAKFGKILTDSKGKTLYFFSKDSKGSSNCSGNCSQIWPIYHHKESSVGTGLDKSLFGEITREDGTKQTTYKGWPLYYFADDITVNDIKGDGIQKIWYVAKPDYLVMVANTQLIGHDSKPYKSDYTEGQGFTSYFTDDHGRTLYAFASDKFNTNTFTKSDFSNDAIWPIFQTTQGSLPSIVTQDHLSIINVHGKQQLAYKGWPLYYFGQDISRGDNKGISFPRPGIWPIVNENTIAASKN